MKRAAALCLIALILHGCTLSQRAVRAAAEPAPTAGTESPAVTAPAPIAAPDAHASQAVDDDLWRKIGRELRLAANEREEVGTAITYFQRNHEVITRAAERSRPYLYYVVTEIERRGLPHELALVPLIESGYRPDATSPHGAAGIWQIMSSTAQRFELVQSRWYDGRRDVIASTTAALTYLESLKRRFRGDWLLALAAYNCGERTVERAIERNRVAGHGTDYWSLDLPRETELYVPRLLALLEIIGHPDAHGIDLAEIPTTAYFDVVDVGGPLDLNKVVAESTFSAEVFEQLNPALRARYVGSGMPTHILVPVGHASAFAAAVAALDDDERVAVRTHTVESGETLSEIALASGSTVAAIKHANGLRSSRIYDGQELLLPPPDSVPGTPGPGASSFIHTITRGDTLWDVARAYGTSVSALTAANGISASQTLRLGNELIVPGLDLPGAEPQTTPATDVVHYEVQPGDSLWTISRQFNVSVAELRKWNRLTSRRYLQPGQKLVVQRREARTDQQKI